jgi:hypothetical protein
MTTATEIVSAALREGNLIAIGVTPTDAEITEGLARLNSFILSLFGHDLGEHLHDWQVPGEQRTAAVAANFPQLPFPPVDLGNGVATVLDTDVYPYPPANSRIVCGITDATTVYFPEQPNDGARMAVVNAGSMAATLTLDGNGRKIEAATTSTIVAGDLTSGQRAWFYRGDLGDWKRIAALVAATESPFPAEFDDMLICGLSIRLSPRYGHEPRQATMAMFQAQRKLFKTRYKQAGTTVYKSYEAPRSLQSYSGRSGWM